MKKIPLTQGQFAIVDDEDFEYLTHWKWHTDRVGGLLYARRNERHPNGKVKGIRMHRQLLGVTDRKMDCDHINGDGLDNRRINLRVCSHSENICNQRISAKNTSGYKGVSWNNRDKKWEVRICVNKKTFFVGYFDDVKIAAQAYDDAASMHHKHFARTNF